MCLVAICLQNSAPALVKLHKKKQKQVQISPDSSAACKLSISCVPLQQQLLLYTHVRLLNLLLLFSWSIKDVELNQKSKLGTGNLNYLPDSSSSLPESSSSLLTGSNNSLPDGNQVSYSEALLGHLAPFTQYAFYVKAVTTSTAEYGAESDIFYFKTEANSTYFCGIRCFVFDVVIFQKANEKKPMLHAVAYQRLVCF